MYRGGGGFKGLELALVGEFLVGAPRALSGADRMAGAVPHLACQPAGCAALGDGRAELIEKRPQQAEPGPSVHPMPGEFYSLGRQGLPGPLVHAPDRLPDRSRLGPTRRGVPEVVVSQRAVVEFESAVVDGAGEHEGHQPRQLVRARRG
ncbi:hypothetical protein ACFFX0_31440 [Citricoccus parietis]|uniref:Uncharacterized protein n=1 Tax=Citricoccus parietis TaxID=592307 RepID=A0ABV5G936_9MICC